MKRTELIKHLTKHNCVLAREGSRHSIYKNKNGAITAVPRHPFVNDFTAKNICRQLDIPVIGNN